MMMPLLNHVAPDAPVAWRAGRPVSAAQLLADARALARRLPTERHVINLCEDRYRFTVAFAASLIARCTSVLPASAAPEALLALESGLPASQRLTNDSIGAHAPVEAFDVPQIDASLCAALIYTSGSTGTPVGHAKRWGQLVECLRAGAMRLGLDGEPHAIVATVPPQHMYGFELSVLLPCVAGHAVCTERPLHAAEVAAVLASVPGPRVLVTTPVHLRTLVASSVAFPPIASIVSATAPLSARLARQAEMRFDAPLREIYGSTETGEMAGRRTAFDAHWTLWPGVELVAAGDGHVARGGHVGAPMPLQDIVTPLDAHTFRLEGRRADLVNIAGRRSSLAYLDHQLQSIPGVVDGRFIAQAGEDAEGIVTRLAALVVAPTLSEAQLREALRRRIDAAFLPRPLVRVPALPRNAVGKLPHADVLALLDRHADRET